MRFEKWIKKQPRGTLKAIERSAGISYTTLLKLRRGERMDSYGLATRISEATGGDVTVEDLCRP